MNRIFFNCGIRTTQGFGQNPEYYQKASNGALKAHEGIDLVPTGGNIKIYSPVKGFVWYDQDQPRGAYGNMIVIAEPYRKLNLYFCHMRENFLSPGDWVNPGDVIGVMGNTGNSFGAHLHLMINRWEKAPGSRLDYDNGYRGMVDPAPYLEEWCNV